MEPPSRPRIEVISRFKATGHTARIRKVVQLVLIQHGQRDAHVCVLLCGDEEIQTLNATFRGVDESTDVLSFPSDAFPGSPLGEIAISLPYAIRQAKARCVDMATEVCYLAIHGTLHLIGYDDETDADRKIMWAETLRAAEAAGLPPDKEWVSALQEATS